MSVVGARSASRCGRRTSGRTPAACRTRAPAEQRARCRARQPGPRGPTPLVHDAWTRRAPMTTPAAALRLPGSSRAARGNSCSSSGSGACAPATGRSRFAGARPQAVHVRSQRRSTRAAAEPRREGATEGGSSADQVRLLLAARAYAAELDAAEEETDEEDVVAKVALGLGGKDDMSDVQRRYAAKMAEVLAEKAAALAAKQRQSSEAFAAGQFLYERGRYGEAVEALELAAREAGEQTQLGGEVNLWLALAYDANAQREQCIALYRKLEDTHPNRDIRKQAADLRYILEAPKLEISPEERVTIPPVLDATQYSDKWARAPPPRRKVPLSWEEEWLANYKPQVYVPNRFVLAATSVISFCLAIYSAWHIRH